MSWRRHPAFVLAPIHAIESGSSLPAELLNFHAAGYWQRSLLAICDEIAGCGEFFTVYACWSYSDHGKLRHC
jgi:hypothetical protein